MYIKHHIDIHINNIFIYVHSQNKFVNKMTDTMNLNEDYKAFIHANKN